MKKIKTTLEETHTRPEGLSIIDPMTEQMIQDFIDKDYSWTTFDEATVKPTEPIIDTEPDWTPNL